MSRRVDNPQPGSFWRSDTDRPVEPSPRRSRWEILAWIRERPSQLSRRQQLILESIIGVALLLILLVYFTPNLLLSKTTTTGGDTGAHIYGPWYLRHYLLPKGEVAGWSPGWFGGFPMYQFYFPLVATAQALLSFLIPYTVAFKLGTITGTFFFPIAVYLLFRLLRLPFPIPIVGSVMALSFLFMDSYTIYGGNIASSQAGEYSFSLSIGLAIVFYGLMYRISVEGKGRPLIAALVLALATLSHLIPVIMLALTAPLLIVWSARRHRWRSALRRAGVVYVLAFAFTAFWAIPLVARLGYTANMRWQPIREFGVLFPRELWIFVLGAVLGAGVGIVRRDPRVLILALPGVLGALLFLFFPQGHVWNGRFVPFWYIAIFLLCAYGVGSLIPVAGRYVWRERSRLVTVAVLGSVVVASGGWIIWNKAHTFVDYWIDYNYSGYEKRPDYPEFKGLMDRIAALPPGRVMWEPSSELGRFGTPVALMSLPYWSGHPSMEGIYFESSFTTPFHFLTASEISQTPSNPIPGLPYHGFGLDRGVEHMKMFDVAYYITVSPSSRSAALANDDLQHIDDVDELSVFALRDHAQVQVPEYEPVRLTTSDWIADNMVWFEGDDLDVPMVRGGSDDWATVSSMTERLPRTQQEHGGEVFDAVVTEDSISFTTTAVGEPHLIRTSYFPNWKVEGAEGPYLASPSMMIVIPTSENVRLYYARSWAEWLGLVITGTVALLVIVPWSRRRLRLWAGP
jgi:6-pyruvoyl-tetrahydropterin synthase-like protein